VRRLALACVGTIAVADYLIHRRGPSWFQIGPLDHAAHVATAALLLPSRKPRPWAINFMAGSLLPDLDHVPLAFQDPEVGDPRPRSHSLLSLAPAALGSHSTALGMLAHFARDICLEPGLPLLWPLSGRQLKFPYGVYATAVTGLAALRAARDSEVPAAAT
jgi:LexA-binding, inner membrane-associated putative hydrolase